MIMNGQTARSGTRCKNPKAASLRNIIGARLQKKAADLCNYVAAIIAVTPLLLRCSRRYFLLWTRSKKTAITMRRRESTDVSGGEFAETVARKPHPHRSTGRTQPY